jgi:hypothetical protein
MPENNEDKWLRYEEDIINHCFERLVEWKEKGMPHAGTYFTSGLCRFIAQSIEQSIKEAGGDRDKLLGQVKNLRDALYKCKVNAFTYGEPDTYNKSAVVDLIYTIARDALKGASV